MDLYMLLMLVQATWNLLPHGTSAESDCSNPDPQPTDRQFIIVEANATWNDAKKYCDEQEGHLLKIDSKDKLDHLQKLDMNPPWNNSLENGEYWIGLHNRENENCSEVHHFWEGGCEPVGWTKWKSGFPDNCNTDQCIVMRNLKWSTANCSSSYSFVCEKEIECEYTKQANITLEDVRVTNVTHKQTTSFSTCKELCRDMAEGDVEGCEMFPDSDMCVFLFLDSGTHEHKLEDSYNGTDYCIKSCSPAKIAQMQPSSTRNENLIEDDDVPETTCASVIGDDYFEYIDAYRVALLPSLYRTLDIKGDVEKCKNICLQTELNDKKCWAVNMFSVLSNFCRLYYLNGEPPYLFYERYKSSKPGLLLLRRRLGRHQIQDDGIVDDIEDLKTDPKNTTMYKMKFFSVYESKPAKISMGAIGAVLIATLIIAIVVADCSLICRHVRTIGARNIRKRTRCKGKKTKKKKKKSNQIEQAPPNETETVKATPSKETSNKDTPSTSDSIETVELVAHCSTKANIV